jgi:hypothetical protein
MAQINLSHPERIQGLKRLGYSEREATFLCLVALHSGYFLRRQYCQFLGKPVGGTAAALIEKLLAHAHAKGTTFAGNSNIYHLCSRPLYAALGQEDNRNRRLRQPIAIKSKLMGFDFVLQHRQHEYLATEQEKVDFFVTHMGIERAFLPVNRYASQGQLTERFFVEKFPIFLSPSTEPALPPVASFCFIDEGDATLSAFSTFLEKYGMLLTRLQEFQMTYVAANDAHFQRAESAFERFSQQLLANGTGLPSDPLATRLLEHFEARRQHEAREWTAFDRARLIGYRNDLQEFSGERFEAFYRLWKASGGAALKALLNSQPHDAGPRRWTFSTCELKENYDLFGYITTH